VTTRNAGSDGPGPTDPRKRIEAIDRVRGFALFGVLLVNMYNFGATSPIWTSPIDKAALSVMRFFFETKSWRLFTFLFGLGFSLQFIRAEARGVRFWPTYLRRLAILFLIGMAHALLYDGDVLMAYAMLGVLLIPFRNASPRLLLSLAVVLLAVFPVGGAVKSLLSDDAPPTAGGSAIVEAQERNEERLREHPYAVGSITDVMAANAEAIPPNLLAYPLDAEGTAAYFAMFLLGLYVGRRRIAQDAEGHRPLIRSMTTWGLGLGLSSMAVERVFAWTWGYDVWGPRGGNLPLEFVGDLLFAYGATALSLGYASGIVMLSRNVRLRRLVQPLGPVGRLALSVYLTQTLAFTTLFYGYGFGQVFRLGPAAVTGYAVLIFALQVLVCGWWVRRYRFGPVEWLWRGLTYGRLPAMRLQALNGQPERPETRATRGSLA
jgi:uncharacterized protein